MAKREIPLPGMGEGVIEAVITRWLVKEGEMVVEDQPLVEVATDKVDSEVVSPAEGRVVKFLHQEGETVPVGAPLLLLEDDRPEEGKEEIVRVDKVKEELLTIPEKEDTVEDPDEKAAEQPADRAGRLLTPW